MAVENYDIGKTDQIAFLTAPAPETLEEVAAIRGIKDTATLSDRARASAELLANDTQVLSGQILSGCEPPARDTVVSLIERINNGDPAALHHANFWGSRTQLYDVASAMMRGLPVEWEITCHTPDFNPSSSPQDYMPHLQVARSLNALNRERGVYRPIFLIEDIADIGTGERLGYEEQEELVLGVAEMLKAQGVLPADHVPGRDFIIKRTSESLTDVPRLARLLITSSHPVFAALGSRLLSATTNTDPEGFHNLSVWTAAEAAGYMRPINRYFTHVSIVPFAGQPDIKSPKGTLRDILRESRLALPEDVQEMPLGRAAPHPLLGAYALLKSFEQQLELFAVHQQRFGSFAAMPAKAYASHSFGEQAADKSEHGILPEDDFILQVLVPWLQHRFAPGEITGQVLDIGAGPNTYLAQLIAPFLASDARLYSCDPAPENREFQRKFKDGSTDDVLAAILPKFERRLLNLGGEMYAGCNERVRDRLIVDYGDIYRLPKGRFAVILEGFVAASIGKEESMYYKAIRSKAEALADSTSISIGLEMLESEEWAVEDEQGNPIAYPSTRVTPKFLLRSHREVGLDAIVVPVVSNGPRLRDGYSGMAIVISWPASASAEIAVRNRALPREYWGSGTVATIG